MTSTYAKVIADSISLAGIRLTTLELYYPLMIHAQLMTHRMFSRNAQSNRAMPVAKMLEQVVNDPAIPSQWGKNQAGMSASEELEDASEDWRLAARIAAKISSDFAEEGYHKQVANRLTMPFQYIKVIVTATEWDNFFKLRLHDADPTMMELARKMKEAMDNSTPKLLHPGEWHLPYVQFDVISRDYFDDTLVQTFHPLEIARKCSAARCARVSYNNHNGTDTDIQKDIALADRLLNDGHMSPFEHQATPMLYPISPNSLSIDRCWEGGVSHIDKHLNYWSGNLQGWIQNRQLL